MHNSVSFDIYMKSWPQSRYQAYLSLPYVTCWKMSFAITLLESWATVDRGLNYSGLRDLVLIFLRTAEKPLGLSLWKEINHPRRIFVTENRRLSSVAFHLVLNMTGILIKAVFVVRHIRRALEAQTYGLPTRRETWVQSLGQEDLLEKEMATHSSILAWKIPWTEEPGRLQSVGLQRVRHDWATSLLPRAHICQSGLWLNTIPRLYWCKDTEAKVLAINFNLEEILIATTY